MLMGMGIFWILLIVAFIFLFKESLQRNRKDNPKSEASAMEVLKQRYAKGDIDRIEFEQKKRDLL